MDIEGAGSGFPLIFPPFVPCDSGAGGGCYPSETSERDTLGDEDEVDKEGSMRPRIWDGEI